MRYIQENDIKIHSLNSLSARNVTLSMIQHNDQFLIGCRCVSCKRKYQLYEVLYYSTDANVPCVFGLGLDELLTIDPLILVEFILYCLKERQAEVKAKYREIIQRNTHWY